MQEKEEKVGFLLPTASFLSLLSPPPQRSWEMFWVCRQASPTYLFLGGGITVPCKKGKKDWRTTDGKERRKVIGKEQGKIRFPPRLESKKWKVLDFFFLVSNWQNVLLIIFNRKKHYPKVLTIVTVITIKTVQMPIIQKHFNLWFASSLAARRFKCFGADTVSKDAFSKPMSVIFKK